MVRSSTSKRRAAASGKPTSAKKPRTGGLDSVKLPSNQNLFSHFGWAAAGSADNDESDDQDDNLSNQSKLTAAKTAAQAQEQAQAVFGSIFASSQAGLSKPGPGDSSKGDKGSLDFSFAFNAAGGDDQSEDEVLKGNWFDKLTGGGYENRTSDRSKKSDPPSQPDIDTNNNSKPDDKPTPASQPEPVAPKAPTVDSAPLHAYLAAFSDRSSWKFNKRLQNTLLTHCFSLVVFPVELTDSLGEYIAGLVGVGVRSRLATTAATELKTALDVINAHSSTGSGKAKPNPNTTSDGMIAARLRNHTTKLVKAQKAARNGSADKKALADAYSNAIRADSILLALAQSADSQPEPSTQQPSTAQPATVDEPVTPADKVEKKVDKKKKTDKKTKSAQPPAKPIASAWDDAGRPSLVTGAIPTGGFGGGKKVVFGDDDDVAEKPAPAAAAAAEPTEKRRRIRSRKVRTGPASGSDSD